MTIMGQLQPGFVEVVKPGTDTVIGYAFTVEDGNGGQLQRWLLNENPNNEFKIRPTSDIDNPTLSDWQAKVNAKWTKGSIYVRAQADVYVHGGTWTQIPPRSALPSATFPPHEADAQTEYRTAGVLKVKQEGSEGLVFTVGSLSDEYSVEYWMLPESYKAAGGASSATVTAGASGSLRTNGLTAGAAAPAVSSLDPNTLPGDVAEELQQFIDLANQTWGPGSRFVITGCINYRGDTAPRAI